MNKDRILEAGKKNIKKILLIRLRSIGDLIVITPCTKAVKDTYPDSHLAVMVEKGFEDIFLKNPYVDEVIILDKKNDDLLEQIKFIFSLRKKKFDMIINLHGGPRSCVMIMLSGARYRVGGLQKKHHFNWVFNVRVAPFDEVLGKDCHHIVERHFATLKCAGIEEEKGGNKKLIFETSEHQDSYVKNILEKNGLQNKTFATIHCNASKTLNKITPKKLAEISDALIDKFSISLVLSGGKQDIEYSNQVALEMKNSVLNLSGKTTIGQTAALYKKSSFFLGIDSGPSHIAAAAGTFIVSIFGPTSPKTWRPWTEKLILIRKNDMDCISCGQKRCKFGNLTKCLEEITGDYVISAIRENKELTNMLKKTN